MRVQSNRTAAVLTTVCLFLTPSLSQNTNSTCRALPLRGEVLYQFNQTDQWIENVAMRRNGDVLFTLAGPRAQVYLMKNPSATDNDPRVTMLHDFSNMIPNATNTSRGDGPTVLVGIAEPRPDVFVTAGGMLTSRRTSVNGTWGVFEIAFLNQTDEVAARKVTDIPGGEWPNGVVAMDPGNSTTNFSSVVLVSDSTRGLVYRVDTQNNSISTALRLDEMAPRPDGQPPFGINGMKMRGDTLYFDNSNSLSFYSVRITADARNVAQGASVQKVGSAENATIFLDDFDIEPDGTIWAAGSFGNTLIAIDPGTKQAIVAAGSNTSLIVGGPTATILAGNGTLYVVTAGAQGDPINGTVKEPGKVMRFNISSFAACKSGSGRGRPVENAATRRAITFTQYVSGLWRRTIRKVDMLW